MSRVSIYDIPRTPCQCEKTGCVYLKAGVCDNPQINKGNSDAKCHRENNKALLQRLVVIS